MAGSPANGMALRSCYGHLWFANKKSFEISQMVSSLGEVIFDQQKTSSNLPVDQTAGYLFVGSQ